MSTYPASYAEIQRLSSQELIQLGEDSLRDHLLHQAICAHQRHGPLTLTNLDAFLADRDCLRYPTRLVFEVGEMARHQFAQPDLDYRVEETEGRILYLHPNLRNLPWAIPLAVAYMVPTINYGSVVRDEHCLLYGATLFGLLEHEFYGQICDLADAIGSEARFEQTQFPSCSASG